VLFADLVELTLGGDAVVQQKVVHGTGICIHVCPGHSRLLP
jgi:Pyruvate/2-oxoacid:ferredoxin oxidoreductase delta subunit